MKRIACLTFLVVFLPLAASAMDFYNWVSVFKNEALQHGISQNTLNDAFEGVTPIPRVIELDRKQPEEHITFEQYKRNVLNRGRIEKGRALYREHKAIIDKIAAQYGVPGPYIVALWGIETSYGQNTGGFYVIPALATLAYDGRRSEFFREELMTALKIVDQGHISLAKMKGSWAGAMGQNQFMPSSFQRFAVDQNGDGRRDIWTSLPDILGSTANYLHQSGWKKDERWGREVNVPAHIASSDHIRPLYEWHKLGVTRPDGKPLTGPSHMMGRLVWPDGVGGPSFLVYDNYQVIKTWNKSTYFATSVGLLADAIAE